MKAPIPNATCNYEHMPGALCMRCGHMEPESPKSLREGPRGRPHRDKNRRAGRKQSKRLRRAALRRRARQLLPGMRVQGVGQKYVVGRHGELRKVRDFPQGGGQRRYISEDEPPEPRSP